MIYCSRISLRTIAGSWRGLAYGVALCSIVLTHLSTAPSVIAAINWDAEAGTQWWFDPVNWDRNSNANMALPPGDSTTGATDTQINIGYGLGAEGVVYDPTNDPNFPPPGSITFPPTFGPQLIRELYISRASSTTNPAANNLLTIKGDLEFRGTVVIGRSSGIDGTFTNGRVNQLSGFVNAPLTEFTIAGPDTSRAGYGNGIYDYRGGKFDIGSIGGAGLRLSHGSNSTNGVTGQPTGASGVGRFIVRNPNSGGYVRAFDVAVASYAGVSDAVTTNADPNGVTRGVGIFEFHYENGRTRPFQVPHNISLNNGFDAATGGTRSSRLDLVLNQAPCTGTACVPNDIGLFDVDFGGIFSGSIQGTGDLNGDTFNDQVFSSADASINYFQGTMVSATFGSVKYNWTISYTGDITWTDADNSVVNTISGTGGTDIVLIGHSSESVGLAGDFDNDGDVDGRDFVLWQRGNSPNGTPGGPVSAADLATWQGAYGNPLAAAVSAVPEPGSLLLVGVATLSLFGLRRSAMRS